MERNKKPREQREKHLGTERSRQRNATSSEEIKIESKEKYMKRKKKYIKRKKKYGEKQTLRRST